ncbi:MAG TPA: transposase [Gemmatimonadaceae bacterium]|nr:transposase [Gemmatimonadaceae bacterium]
MALDAVLARFVAQCPVAVMARLALQRAISAEWVDGVFEAHRERQYTRELLFSTVVDLMSLVALGLRPSLHAAAQQAIAGGALGVSLAALYEKVNHAEPAVLRALVRGSGARLTRVVTRLAPPTDDRPALAGYRLRVVDGNHLPATEHRVGPLRAVRAAALPGLSLVVYDPATDLVVDLVPGEDAHAGERGLMPAVAAAAGPNELWIADRNFATRAFLGALVARGAAVLVREHGRTPAPVAVGPWRRVGRCATGTLAEQAVEVVLPNGDSGGDSGGGRVLPLRRIELTLDAPTEDGDTVLRLLTTLPRRVSARRAAELYRRRWSIEGMFQRLEAALASEVATLGQPRAALLAFAVAVVAYNVLATVEAALAAEAAARAEASAVAPVPISTYYVAHEVREAYRGLLIAVAAAVWARYDRQEPAALARTLRTLAGHARLPAFRKHPKPATPKRPKGYVPLHEVKRTVATARLLAEEKQKQRPRRSP